MNIEAAKTGNDGALIKIKDAAAKLDVSQRTVWRMIADGQLAAVRVRRCTRLSLSQVMNLLQGGGKVGGL